MKAKSAESTDWNHFTALSEGAGQQKKASEFLKTQNGLRQGDDGTVVDLNGAKAGGFEPHIAFLQVLSQFS